MTQIKTNSAYDQFAFFHQNEALLYQYILHEALQTYEKLQNIPDSKEVLESLLGMPCQNWQGRSGHLHKLNSFVALLNIHFTHTEHFYGKALAQLLENAFHLGQTSRLLNKDSAEAITLYLQLKTTLKKILELLLDQLSLFQDDEHVLYFILKIGECLKILFEESVMQKIFTCLFPGGLKEGISYIGHQYAQKGFNHLIPQIESYANG